MPRNKIDGSFRERYGLPPNTLGLHYQKDAVKFYRRFCVPRGWDEMLRPVTFEVLVADLIRFAEELGRIEPLSMSATKAELVYRNNRLCQWRLAVNKAALSEPVWDIIEWCYSIEPEVNGRLYRVMTVETRNANGKDVDRIEGFAKAKRKGLDRRYAAIKEDHHSPVELASFKAKGESDDKLMDDLKRGVTSARKRIATDPTISKLAKWKDI